jgi:hypothetical protein
MTKDPGAVALGKKRAKNLRKKLGSEKALKEHMRQVRAGKCCPSAIPHPLG